MKYKIELTEKELKLIMNACLSKVTKKFLYQITSFPCSNEYNKLYKKIKSQSESQEDEYYGY